MKINKRQAWYFAVFWASMAGLLTGVAGGGFYGFVVFAGLLSIASAVQFDPES